MDELSLVESIINTEVDDLVLDLVYEIHSSLKGIPEEQLDLSSSVAKTKLLSMPSPQSQATAIDKQTCVCPRCGQSNIVAIRFAYHLAKCLGVGRRSSRQAKHRIVDQVTTITGLSDDSRSNGDEFQHAEINNILPEDGGSCTDSTSSSSNNHRRAANEDQEYNGNVDEEEEDDWKPKRKKRRSTTMNVNAGSKNRKRREKSGHLPVPHPIADLDFHTCVIPLDKLSPSSQHTAFPQVTASRPPNSEEIFFGNRRTCPSPPSSSYFSVRSPLNLVEDEQSSATSIILFHEDSRR